MASTSTPESSISIRNGRNDDYTKRSSSRDDVVATAIPQSRDPLHDMPELPAYYGNDIQEAQDFISKAERRFRLDRGYYHPDDTSKIDYCVLAFEQKPYRKWSIFEEDAGGPGHITWEQFKTHLFDSICDTQNRQMNAIVAYQEARQQEGQTTDDFAADLQVLERKELGYTDRQETGIYAIWEATVETTGRDL